MIKKENMKVVILAGGIGYRPSYLLEPIPKPMVEIGGFPLIWHLMKYFSFYGYNDFVICGGYKQEVIRSYFTNYFVNHGDVTFHLIDNTVSLANDTGEPWNVTIRDTGINTMTGGRIRRIKDLVDGKPFFLCYGDCLSDIDLDVLFAFHKASKSKATISLVDSNQRFGLINIDAKGFVDSFREKTDGVSSLVNAGFMVLEPSVIDLISGDDVVLEKYPFEELTRQKELSAYVHHGFCQVLDNERDRVRFENLWKSGKAPWMKK